MSVISGRWDWRCCCWWWRCCCPKGRPKAEGRSPKENRNPKAEARKKLEGRSPKFGGPRNSPRLLRTSDFDLGLLSGFGFRPSERCLGTAARIYVHAALSGPGVGFALERVARLQGGQVRAIHGEYEELLQRKGDDPRLRFNAGAAAYRNRQFDEAAKQFDEAVAAPDLNLQALAYYNRGNTHYRLGESIPDPSKRRKLGSNHSRITS